MRSQRANPRHHLGVRGIVALCRTAGTRYDAKHYREPDMALDRSTPNADDYQRVPRPIGAMAKDFPHGYHIPVARHERGQLVYAISGVMTVTTPHGTWVVPPQRAVWVPPRIDHESRMSGRVQMRTLYLRRDVARALPARCCVVSVSPLLRELILAATAMPVLYNQRGRDGRIMALILDELGVASDLPLSLPRPRDRRLARVCDAMLELPADERSLEEWARTVGASARTLARLFRRDTGMSFAAWRQQARLLESLRRLAGGEPVTKVALDCGYRSASAFGAMFRRALGVAPKEYFAPTRRPPPQ
jgi:AraC-like DNA-binding protein